MYQFDARSFAALTPAPVCVFARPFPSRACACPQWVRRDGGPPRFLWLREEDLLPEEIALYKEGPSAGDADSHADAGAGEASNHNDGSSDSDDVVPNETGSEAARKKGAVEDEKEGMAPVGEEGASDGGGGGAAGSA